MDLAEVEKFEAPVKVLKLSEAIRIVAKIRPHNKDGGFFRNGASCALGAAVEAKTGMANSDFDYDWERFFGVEEFILGNVINMNDRTNLTREDIADWLESQGF